MYQSIFFFNDTATTEIYTLSLHDALPISYLGMARLIGERAIHRSQGLWRSAKSYHLSHRCLFDHGALLSKAQQRSEEHTSELQSRQYLVCRLLLEKKKTNNICHNLRCEQT